MRVATLLPLLVLLVSLLSGCTGGGNGDTNDNGTDGDDGTDGTDPSPTTNATSPPAAKEVAPPGEQREDDPEDLDRPGEYAMRARAAEHTDARWDVPAWVQGDMWRYRHHITAGNTGCDPEAEDKVTATDEVLDVPVYHIERTEIDCTDGTRADVQHLNFTMTDLVEIQDDGYIEHIFVFPLEDGQRWVYARSDGKGGISKVDATARHEEQYLWPGKNELVEAWHVLLEFEGEGNVQMKYWIGVDQKNVLRREIWADSADGVSTMFFSTTLVSYTPG